MDLFNLFVNLTQDARISKEVFRHSFERTNIVLILKSRADSGDHSSYAPHGAITLNSASAVKSADLDPSELCKEAILYLEKAADDRNVSAINLISDAYAEGTCKPKSKFAAVEWLLKAESIYEERNLRDESLALLEKALTLVPDHPEAKSRLEALLKPRPAQKQPLQKH